MDQPQRRPGSRGPLPKGDRRKKNIDFEVDVLDRIKEVAEDEGLSPADVINRLCALGLGMTPPAYSLPKPRNDQKELPLAEAS